MTQKVTAHIVITYASGQQETMRLEAPDPETDVVHVVTPSMNPADALNPEMTAHSRIEARKLVRRYLRRSGI